MMVPEQNRANQHILILSYITLRKTSALEDDKATLINLHGRVGGGALHIVPWLWRLWRSKPQGPQRRLSKRDAQEDSHRL